MIPHTEPRPYLLRPGPDGSPLLICLPGYSQRIAEPDDTRWYDRLAGQWRKNFVAESRLLELDCSVCFVSPSRYTWAPWYARNWSQADTEDVLRITQDAIQRCQPRGVFAFGFSDGATFAHHLGVNTLAYDAVVCHSGLWPRWMVDEAGYVIDSAPCLLVCGIEEPHRKVASSQVEIFKLYEAAGVPCASWLIPGGHEWCVDNRDALEWCLEQLA